jgi:hypothetical protein
MESIRFLYSEWWIIACIALGLIYALVLYFRDQSFRDRSDRLNWLLGIFRFLTVSALAILLLEPFLKSIETQTKKPIVVLAQDQSESVSAEMDEAELTAYQAEFNTLKNTLGEQYEVKDYAFGSEVREGVDFDFSDKVSNLSEALNGIYDLYSNQNLGAIVLATDGIYNEGSNPVYAGTQLAVPIYTVALGDTTAKKDVIIKRVFHNRIAYLGDKFSVQVDVSAKNCIGANTRLMVYKVQNGGTQKLAERPVNIDRNDFFKTEEVILDAENVGVQRYRIVVNQVNGEEITANNSKDIFVDVLDARQKVLIVANAPHPDLTALKQTINSNKNYEAEVGYVNKLKKKIEDYDFVILHQLPSLVNDALGVINNLKKNKIPHLFIVGTQTDLRRFNVAQNLITIQGDGKNTDEVQARIAPNFNLFTLSEEVNNQMTDFVPLIAPFGEYEVGANTQTLLYQRIGKIDTEKPLLVFGEEDGIKRGVLTGEGVWKWRLFNYLQEQNHEVFDEVIGKSVQYVSLKEDKRRFRVSLAKNIFKENEAIFFDAELYNNSYELINEPDVSLVITSEEGNDFNFTFNKTDKAYTINAGIFPVGNYTFRSNVFYGGEQLSYQGQFSVQPIQLEIYETTANHNLLKVLSDKFGGQLIYPGQVSTIANFMADQKTIVPVIYESSKTQSVINLRWIFFLLLTLLTVEWFLRRYFGAY